MCKMTFEEFENLTKKNKSEAKKYLEKTWGTNRLISYIDKVKPEEEYNKFVFSKPKNLNNEYIYNPFTGNKMDSCYIRLDNTTCGAIQGKFILFEFDININKKFNKEALIKGVFLDIITDYEEILSEFNINTQVSKDIYEKNNIPLNMYNFFKKLNENLINETTLISTNISELANIQKNLSKNIEKQERETRKEKIEQIENEIKYNEQKLNDIKEKISKYEELGIILQSPMKNNEIRGRRDILDADSQIDYIHKYLEVKEGLYYKKDIIRKFYVALKTKQIVILSGPPGTGKTSIVKYFANAIGAEAKIIPVQTNWSDNQDLLGFYNPIEKYYFSTPFLDSLVEAKENPQKLYFICLDEMNLARVEYYFSEFLSVLEKNKDTDKVLNLYSKFIYNDLKNKVDKIAKEGKTEALLDDKEKDIINQFNFLRRYPAEFTIPTNVRFIGTINADETTKEFSPKVIDRSLIIELLEEKEEREENIYDDIEVDENLYIIPKEFEIEEDYKVIEENIYNIVYDIKKQLTYLNVSLTKRFDKQIRELFNAYDWKEVNSFLDYIISSKILPKISVTYDNKEDKIYKALKSIKEILQVYPVSINKLNKMLDKAEKCEIVTYWI